MRLLLIFGLGSITLFLLIRLVSFLGIPWLNVPGERDFFINAAKQNLQVIADEKKETVQQWFEERLGDGRTVVAFPAFHNHALQLSRQVHGVNGGPAERIRERIESYADYRQIRDRLMIVGRGHAQYDAVLLVDRGTGICLASTDGEAVGRQAPYLQPLWDDDAWSERVFFAAAENKERVFLHLAFAVKGADEKVAAALVFRILPETFLVRLFHESPALGATGEIILIDRERRLLTPLKYSLPDGSPAQPLSHILQTKPAEVAALGVDTLLVALDYRGVPVFAAVRHVRITPDFGFGLIVKRDESDVYAPVRQGLLVTGVVTGLGLGLLLLLFAAAAGAIASPLENLTAAARKIASGDLSARASTQGKGEVEVLARSFNEMADRIQQSHEHLEAQVRERTAELEVNIQLLRVEMEERRAAEREIRASEERFRQLAENIPEVFWIVSSDWQKVHYISPAYEKIWGRRCEDLYENPSGWIDAVVQEDRQALLAAIPERVLERDLLAFPDYRIRRPDGSVRWIASRAVGVADADGTVSRVAGIMEDITERKLLEAQLIQAQKMESVGRLAGGVAHDFNNMLAVIFISLELARMRLRPDDPAHEQLQEIEKAATRSRDITRQLLAFSRKQMIAPKACNLNELIADLEKSLTRLIGEDIELRFYPGQDLGLINIDPSQIDQILVNLAVNARDAMPHGGKLTITTANVSFDEDYCREHADARPGRYVQLSVTDDGVGMSAETRSHLFEPFFTTKEVGKGTGLGLAMIYGIIRQNEGFVNVYSELGHGTSFKLYFPRVEEREGAAELPEPMPPERGAGRIMLVEDDEILCRVTRATLETLGYEVTTAHSPAEALDLFEHDGRSYALLLTDVVMPGMNGRELADRCAAKCPGMRVIFMSGYTSDAVVHRGVLEEGVHFIQKPFSVRALASKIQEVLGK